MPPLMKNIVCLISGRGSNLQAILAAQRERDWPGTLGAQVAAVISNRAGARGLQIAAAQGVPAQVLAHGDYAERADFDAALAQAIDRYEPALVVLAGFLRVLTPGFVQRYAGRLVNIHPSLLPAFTGLDTHARALAAGVRVHGSTVHYVSGDLDAGPIIAQAALAVAPDEAEEALAARVLALEHLLLPRCIEWILQGRVHLAGGRVQVRGLDAADLLVRAA
jgi:phosphoribosylglycinamide formyltransferase-1